MLKAFWLFCSQGIMVMIAQKSIDKYWEGLKEMILNKKPVVPRGVISFK